MAAYRLLTMRPRSAKSLLQVAKGDRPAVLAEGLTLLAEHVATLERSVRLLDDAGEHRGAAVVAVTANEEAAKFLILVDFARMGDATDTELSMQLSRFANHQARCLYCYLSDFSPATFGELRNLANLARRSHYLDGPEGLEWTFRNYLIARREEALYVDYVDADDGSTWISPAGGEPSWPRGTSGAVPLVRHLALAGLTTVEGLRILDDRWSGVAIDDSTHWVAVEQLNADVLGDLQDAGTVDSRLEATHFRYIADRWTYPLFHLDLREIPVKPAELADQRQAGLDALLS
jgi:AbiV family abortive infection protein